MERDISRCEFEAAMVRHCAPTLAGVKPAGMFTFPGAFAHACDVCAHPDDACDGEIGRARAALRAVVDACSKDTGPFGVMVSILAWRPFGAIVYVWRPRMLARELTDARTRRELAHLGYRWQDGPQDGSGEEVAHHAVAHLMVRFTRRRVPHEVGFFLGYPYEDVMGFVEHGGADYICCGCWKVYANARGALRSFSRYRRCTRRCERLHQRGASLRALATLPGEAGSAWNAA